MTAVALEALVEPRRTLAAHGRSFNHAARLLGPAHARRAALLYAWCRQVDDLADEAAGEAERRWASARLHALLGALEADDRRDHLASVLLDLCDEVGADPAPAVALVRGVARDLGPVAVPDERALLRYCHGVAGTVGLLMLPVLDVHDPAARPFAVDLGIAMQLTNIARDVVEDAGRGRRYLPGTWVGDREPGSIATPDERTRAAVVAAVRRTLETAERYYVSGEAGLAYLPPRPRAAIRVAARVYRRIGRRLAGRDHDVWAGRTVVPAAVKGAVTVASLGREVRPVGSLPRHDGRLHADLAGMIGAAR